MIRARHPPPRRPPYPSDIAGAVRSKSLKIVVDLITGVQSKLYRLIKKTDKTFSCQQFVSDFKKVDIYGKLGSCSSGLQNNSSKLISNEVVAIPARHVGMGGACGQKAEFLLSRPQFFLDYQSRDSFGNKSSS